MTKTKKSQNNNFLGGVGAKGYVKMYHGDSEGNIKHSYESNNVALTGAMKALAFMMINGTIDAGNGGRGISTFYTGATYSSGNLTAANGKDGIMVFAHSATGGSKGTLLACTTAAGGLDNYSWSGSGSLAENSTMSRFELGVSRQSNDGGQLLHQSFQHSPTPFAYSAGDTLTVNWGVTITG